MGANVENWKRYASESPQHGARSRIVLRRGRFQVSLLSWKQGPGGGATLLGRPPSALKSSTIQSGIHRRGNPIVRNRFIVSNLLSVGRSGVCENPRGPEQEGVYELRRKKGRGVRDYDGGQLPRGNKQRHGAIQYKMAPSALTLATWY